jgi:flagellar biogenesis protein FliO
MTPGQLWGLVLGVFVFVAVLAGFVYLSKRMSSGAVLSGRRIKIIDRIMVARDSTILLVQIGTRLMAVGVGKGPPTFICELSASDFPELSKNPEAETADTDGFWKRFKRHFKANLTGKTAGRKNESSSFAAVLQEIAEKDPPPGTTNAGVAGYPRFTEEERRPPQQRFRRGGYQKSIENMNRLSEPDSLDRRTRGYATPPPYPHSPQQAAQIHPPQQAAPPPAPVPARTVLPPAENMEERGERIDQLLDIIAQRQSRMAQNDTGDKG